MKVEPYLFFDGRCEEALEFYRSALGAKVTALMRFKENPDPGAGEGCGDGPAPSPEMIMHASFTIGETQVMASDGLAPGTAKFEGISMSLSPADEAEAQRVFNALAEGGKVQMPLAATFFSSAFGMVADRFGVPWMVVAPGPDMP